MAHIETRTTRDGRTTTYAVKWRDGGTRAGAPHTQTVDDPTTAETLRGLIKLAGNRWPSDDQLIAFGLAQLVADPVEPAGPLTVTELCTAYITSLVKLGPDGPAEDAIKLYRGYVTRHIEPLPLGKMLAADVDHDDIEDWQSWLRTHISPGGRRVLSPVTVRNVRGAVLSAAYRWACSRRSGDRDTGPMLTYNPCVDARLPRAGTRTVREILTNPAEYAVMLAEARALDPEWADMTELTAATGLRWIEVSRLAPTAFDVRRLTMKVPGAKRGGWRIVPVPADIMARVVVPRLARAGDRLFTRPGGKRWAYSLDQDRWTALRARLAARGMVVHLTHHCLRHGYITWMKSAHARIDPDKVSMVVGHKVTSMTAHYTQMTEHDLDAIRAAAAQLVGAAA